VYIVGVCLPTPKNFYIVRNITRWIRCVMFQFFSSVTSIVSRKSHNILCVHFHESYNFGKKYFLISQIDIDNNNNNHDDDGVLHIVLMRPLLIIQFCCCCFLPFFDFKFSWIAPTRRITASLFLILGMDVHFASLTIFLLTSAWNENHERVEESKVALCHPNITLPSLFVNLIAPSIKSSDVKTFYLPMITSQKRICVRWGLVRSISSRVYRKIYFHGIMRVN
jgi:hypothetical protein